MAIKSSRKSLVLGFLMGVIVSSASVAIANPMQFAAKSNATLNNIQHSFHAPAPTGRTTSIQNMPSLSLDLDSENGGFARFVQTFTDNLGNQYPNGGVEVDSAYFNQEHVFDGTYLLKKEYSSFSGYLVPSVEWSAQPKVANLGHLEILADGKTIYSSGPINSTATEPQQVNVSLKGVQTLEIKLTSLQNRFSGNGYLGLVQCVFVK